MHWCTRHLAQHIIVLATVLSTYLVSACVLLRITSAFCAHPCNRSTVPLRCSVLARDRMQRGGDGSVVLLEVLLDGGVMALDYSTVGLVL